MALENKPVVSVLCHLDHTLLKQLTNLQSTNDIPQSTDLLNLVAFLKAMSCCFSEPSNQPLLAKKFGIPSFMQSLAFSFNNGNVLIEGLIHSIRHFSTLANSTVPLNISVPLKALQLYGIFSFMIF